MYLFELIVQWWWILTPAFALAGLVAAIAIPPSSDALDLVQRYSFRHRERLAERAREYERKYIPQSDKGNAA